MLQVRLVGSSTIDVMNTLLVLAAFLAAATAAAHSWLGERYILVRLLRRTDLPRLFGDDSFTRQTLRFAWHLTSVAWVGFAAVLLLVGGVLGNVPVGSGLLIIVAATFLVSAALAVVFTRARHLSWVVFLTIAALCLIVSS